MIPFIITLGSLERKSFMAQPNISWILEILEFFLFFKSSTVWSSYSRHEQCLHALQLGAYSWHQVDWPSPPTLESSPATRYSAFLPCSSSSISFGWVLYITSNGRILKDLQCEELGSSKKFWRQPQFFKVTCNRSPSHRNWPNKDWRIL